MITERQKMVLRKRADGFCYRGTWKWICNDEPVTREINTLKKRGLIDIFVYDGGHRAAANPTEAGRQALVEANSGK